MRRAWVTAAAFTSFIAHAAVPQPSPQSRKLIDQLTAIRLKVMSLEQGLLDGTQSQDEAKENLKKIHLLLKLQKEERELGRRRLKDLEATIKELEDRRGKLEDKVKGERAGIRRYLKTIETSVEGRGGDSEGESKDMTAQFLLPEREKFEAPKRRLLANLVDHGIKEMEALNVDLSDGEKLEGHIQEEKQQLAYLFQDLNEQEGVLELNQQLQADLLKRKREERLVQLRNYRKFKEAEMQVEHLIGDFNARKELERVNEADREAVRMATAGVFARLKGKLPFPVAGGRILSGFGRVFDPKSRLFVFKKGVSIAVPDKSQRVRAIYPGKIAYAGELPDYGRVAIVDHGDHFYSLCAHLGSVIGKAGDPVAAGDVIGITDDLGTPVYFEIRSRNVPVNPLQWVSN